MLSTMVPFFNSQVQGLDVLYRALRGRLPFAEQLDLKRKLYARGMMLTVGVMAYAAMMQDDEAYKKATPQERYSNLFLPLPGLKEPLKIPIPYEVGVLFVALPQMVIDIAFRDTKARDALKGMGVCYGNLYRALFPQALSPYWRRLMEALPLARLSLNGRRRQIKPNTGLETQHPKRCV